MKTNFEVDIINMDDLAIMTDDQLLDRLRMLESERDQAFDSRLETKNWEVEICYVRRELQLRRARHQQHEIYLQVLDREAIEAQRYENTFPVADLDNSAFMFFN